MQIVYKKQDVKKKKKLTVFGLQMCTSVYLGWGILGNMRVKILEKWKGNA